MRNDSARVATYPNFLHSLCAFKQIHAGSATRLDHPCRHPPEDNFILTYDIHVTICRKLEN